MQLQPSVDSTQVASTALMLFCTTHPSSTSMASSFTMAAPLRSPFPFALGAGHAFLHPAETVGLKNLNDSGSQAPAIRKSRRDFSPTLGGATNETYLRYLSPIVASDLRDLLCAPTGRDVTRCPRCHDQLERVPLPVRAARAPPAVFA